MKEEDLPEEARYLVIQMTDESMRSMAEEVEEQCMWVHCKSLEEGSETGEEG